MSDSDAAKTEEKLSPIRQKVADFFEAKIPYSDVTSNGDTGALFRTLTGWDQDALDATWKIEQAARDNAKAHGKSPRELGLLPNTTTCNAFLVQLGHVFGSPMPLGQFYLDNVLTKAGYGEAWVPANSGQRPRIGDVFIARSRGHMGTSLKFVGDRWYTVESGQGGHTLGYDILRRKDTNWDPSYLLGWADIDLLMQLSRPAPSWLKGWWIFDLNGTTAYIFFGDKPQNMCFLKKPPQMKSHPWFSDWIVVSHLSEDGQSVTLDFGARGGGTVKNVKPAGTGALAGSRDGGIKITATQPA